MINAYNPTAWEESLGCDFQQIPQSFMFSTMFQETGISYTCVHLIIVMEAWDKKLLVKELSVAKYQILKLPSKWKSKLSWKVRVYVDFSLETHLI